MILTTVENYDKNKGTDLPMFSRPGKFTKNQYLAFGAKNQEFTRSPASDKSSSTSSSRETGMLL
jgi:hypothetical protein